MLKALVAVIFVVGMNEHSVMCRQDEANQHQQIRANSIETASESAIYLPLFHDPESNQKESHSENKRSDWKEWFWPPIWSNWALVVVAACGIRVALRTLKALEKQADAQINSERAWLIVELVPTAVTFDRRRFIPVAGYTGELSEDDLSDGRQFEYRLKVTNMGKTPAVILKYTISQSSPAKGEHLIDFELPYHSIGASGQWYIYTLDVDREVRNYSADETVFFFGNVSYQHVFSNKDTLQEPFAYIFKRETGRLERMPMAEQYERGKKPN